MITLNNVLCERGYKYTTVFMGRAEDIYFEDTRELCYSLGYILKNYKKLDAEIPINSNVVRQIKPNYLITNGYTSGGNKMKQAPQLRIYFKTLKGIPQKLKLRLQNDNQMRITGSLFIEACLHVGFTHGHCQDEELIQKSIKEIFWDDEVEAFLDGYKK